MEVYIERENSRYHLVMDDKAAVILDLMIALAYMSSLAGLLQGKETVGLEDMRVLLEVIRGREK